MALVLIKVESCWPLYNIINRYTITFHKSKLGTFRSFQKTLQALRYPNFSPLNHAPRNLSNLVLSKVSPFLFQKVAKNFRSSINNLSCPKTLQVIFFRLILKRNMIKYRDTKLSIFLDKPPFNFSFEKIYTIIEKRYKILFNQRNSGFLLFVT